MKTQAARVQLTGFHAGELEVQRRAGVQEKAQQIQQLFVSRPVTEQLQTFFASQRLLFTAVRQDFTNSLLLYMLHGLQAAFICASQPACL